MRRTLPGRELHRGVALGRCVEFGVEQAKELETYLAKNKAGAAVAALMRFGGWRARRHARRLCCSFTRRFSHAGHGSSAPGLLREHALDVVGLEERGAHQREALQHGVAEHRR